MKVEFVSATTIANVTRLGFFERGSNAACLNSKICDMSKLVFSLVWADNEEFIDEYECRFQILNKNRPKISIDYRKSLLACEEPLFKWEFDNIEQDSYDKVQIHDVLFVLGMTMVNSQYLFELLPPFDTISMYTTHCLLNLLQELEVTVVAVYIVTCLILFGGCVSMNGKQRKHCNSHGVDNITSIKYTVW